MSLPGPAGWFPSGANFKWRGAEPFAGDLVQSLIENGSFGKQFLANMAFYRDGLKPWQRGLEIGMAHGYFLIGPFTSLGPLRNTPEAATVGLLCGCAIVGLVSIGGLIFGSTIKPTRFDKEGCCGHQQIPRVQLLLPRRSPQAACGLGGAPPAQRAASQPWAVN